jgi:hypothetical protein
VMRDPHVVSLNYRLIPGERVTFAKQAAPVEAEANGFTVRLAGESLVVEMHAHHAKEESARSAVEPYLRAWEVSHALRVGGDAEFHFEFIRAELIDRDPPPPGTPQTIQASALVHGRAIFSATVSVERASLPEPPSAFAVDAEVETLWARWRAYREGREPLQGMAYFVLTVVEMHGGRRAAAARLGIATTVLSTLGRLVSEAGDVTTARKAVAAARPLTPQETAWLVAAVIAIIRRVGGVAAAGSATSLPQLTMNDLPPLSPP